MASASMTRFLASINVCSVSASTSLHHTNEHIISTCKYYGSSVEAIRGGGG